MKKLLPLMLAVALVIPASSAFAAKGAKKAKKSPASAIETCSGDKDVKCVSLGKEVVYVSNDLKSVSFTQDEMHSLKHNLMYYSPKTGYSRRTPGTDPEGNALVPAFKHGETWYLLSRDANGNVIVESTVGQTETTIAPATDEQKSVVKQGKAKKVKNNKKAKKAK